MSSTGSAPASQAAKLEAVAEVGPPDVPPAQADFRSGSNSTPATGASAQPVALRQVLAELQALGTVSVEEQQRLMADLERSDPSLWPQMLAYSKAAAARRREQAAAEQAVRATGGAANVSVAPSNAAPGAPPELAATPPRGTAMHAMSAAGELPRAGSAVQPAGPYPVIGTEGSDLTTSALAVASPGVVGTAPSPVVSGVVQTTFTASIGAEAAAPSAARATSEGALASAAAPGPSTASAPAMRASWEAQLDAAIRALEASLAGGGDETQVARLRLLQLAAGRRDAAVEAVPGASSSQQAFWSSEMFGLAALLEADKTPDVSRRAALAQVHLREAQSRLSETAPLVVKNLAFCTEVRSFGITVPFEIYEFAPGQEVLLYAELENFTTEETPKGHHTSLRSTYEIFDAEGRRVDRHEFATTEETCRNRRQDFFIRYFLQLPKEQLFEGKHRLRLTIEDVLGQKVAEGSLDFTVKRQ